MTTQHNRARLVAIAFLIFLSYVAWNAHTPGQPRTLKDFLFVLGIFAVPFCVFMYAITSFSSWRDTAAPADEIGLRHRLAIIGSVLGSASAALLLLLLPFWTMAVEHQLLEDCWIITGAATAIGAVLCGIVGAPRWRRAALFSILLVPFWFVVTIFLVKAAMD